MPLSFVSCFYIDFGVPTLIPNLLFLQIYLSQSVLEKNIADAYQIFSNYFSHLGQPSSMKLYQACCWPVSQTLSFWQSNSIFATLARDSALLKEYLHGLHLQENRNHEEGIKKEGTIVQLQNTLHKMDLVTQSQYNRLERWDLYCIFFGISCNLDGNLYT